MNGVIVFGARASRIWSREGTRVRHGSSAIDIGLTWLADALPPSLLFDAKEERERE